MAARWDKGGKDYINCPMDRPQYEAFVAALNAGEKTEFKDWERDTPYFEGCMPIEVMAERGPETLRHGPMKPIGLDNPRTGRWPYAVVQLRQDNALGTLWNMVGFQTKLKHGEQVRIFRTIPGLEHAEFARLGGIHRNSFINSPRLLDRELRLKSKPNIRFAGQITGCEGYVESAAIGLIAARFAAAELRGETLPAPPPETAIGALLGHITGGADADTYQPMNINFGLMPPPEGRTQESRPQESLHRPRPSRAGRVARAGERTRGRTRLTASAPAPRVLRRRGRGARVFGRGQPARAVRVGAAELVDRLHRPFLERQRAVAVGVELGERLAPRREHFLRLDAPVLVLVDPGKALLLAAFGGRLGGLRDDVGDQHRRRSGARRRRLGQASDASPRPPCHSRKRSGHEQQGGRGPGEKARHGAPPIKEIRRDRRCASARREVNLC